MTLTDSRKTDIAFKKLINKDFTDTSKAWYEENDGGGFNVNLSTVWADTIPSTPPTSSNSVVEVWDDLVLTEDVSVAGERSWKAISGGAQLRYWIPPKYGQGYTVKIYEDDGTGGKGDQIFTTDPSDWFFDYEEGILTFQDNHSFTTPIHLEGYRYIGRTSAVTRITTPGGDEVNGVVEISGSSGINVTQSGNTIEISKDPEADIRVKDSSGTPTYVGYNAGSEAVPVRTKSGESVSVSATNLDIRDLSKSSDSVSIWSNTAKDGTGTSLVPIVDSDGHLQVDVLSGGGGGGTQYTEGETDSTFTGTIMMAEGPSDTATPIQVNSNKYLRVEIAQDSVGIGGGVQYTEGDVDSSITGDAIMWEDSGDTLRPVSAAYPLPTEVTNTVSIQDGGGSITVDASNLDIRNLTKSNDEIYAVLRTDAGTAYDSRDRNWNLANASDSVTAHQGGTWSDVGINIDSDNVGLSKEHTTATSYHSTRLTNGTAFIDPRDRNWIITETVDVAGNVTIQEPLSIDDNGSSITVDNSNLDNLQFNAADDLKVTLDGESVTVTATNLDIRNLTKSNDEIYSVLRTDGGTAYDARDRNWTLGNLYDSVRSYKGGTWSLDSPSDGTYIGDIKFGESLPAGTNNIGKVDINDISAGTQTNDVKVTLDGETVTVSDGGGSITVDGTVTAEPGKTSYLRGYNKTSSEDVVSAPGSGKALKIYSIQANNANSNNDVEIEFKEGSTGNVLLRWFLIRQGGGDTWRSMRGYQLPENTSLYLNIVTGASPDVNISVEWDEVSV